jgi:Tripartite ATP-independent periplasmic transporter, DctM component
LLLRNAFRIVVPAKAGIDFSTARATARWVPAFAGTTDREFRLMSSEIAANDLREPEPQEGEPASPLRRAMDVLYRACAIIAGSALVLISLVVPWGVYTRYVLESAASWPEPMAILLSIVLTFFGAAVAEGGMARRLVAFANVLVGLLRLRGGLSLVNIMATTFMSGISGSSVADASAIGSVMIPQMEKSGCPRVFSTNVTIAASVQGLLVPPSHNRSFIRWRRAARFRLRASSWPGSCRGYCSASR